MCNSEKKDNLFRKRYKLTHGDKCYSIIKYFCPEVEFISIKIMETGERGSIDSFKAALEWCLKEKIKLVHMSVGTTNYIDAKKIENIIKQMVSNKMILCAALSNDVGVKTINKFNPIPYSTLKNSYFVVYRRGLGNI